MKKCWRSQIPCGRIWSNTRTKATTALSRATFRALLLPVPMRQKWASSLQEANWQKTCHRTMSILASYVAANMSPCSTNREARKNLANGWAGWCWVMKKTRSGYSAPPYFRTRFLKNKIHMSDTIEDEKFVELNYRVIDNKTGDILVTVDYPLGYVHGVNDVMSEDVTKALYGKKVGDIIEVPIDTKLLYGERDESLVFTDRIENVPEEYREIGMTITMENERGEPRNFIVTRFDDKTLTIDGNNPLCGREVTFMLEVLSIREATEEEIELGGAVGADPALNEILERAQ